MAQGDADHDDTAGTPRAPALVKAARRLELAIGSLDAALEGVAEAPSARRQVEVMAEDRARLAEALRQAEGGVEDVREAGGRAMREVRSAREAVRGALDVLEP